MHIDPAIVQQQIENLRLLFPELAEDEEGWALSLESETELMPMLEQIVMAMRDAAAMAGGIAGRIAELEIRQGRFTRREQAMRILAFRLMQHADIRKCELPEATLSIRNGTPKVIITDEQAIPDYLCRMKREPDKTKIKEHLTSGDPVTGAELSNAEPTLAVRTK